MRALVALVLEGGMQILRNREGQLVCLFKIKALGNHISSVVAHFWVYV